ncbi:hypothetical protein JMN32_11010 [Fulvivirga sp. 29W222]|uniref:Uncharacterized protein n=1 Tax=Fulvivirga marina TaxID=2494733 RepID=A0A937FVQ7_9BACT|nr:hypothetical protein [Fulvivirga marina]MBL6446844.1 hypothetical protein [Fulvivirga marina]
MNKQRHISNYKQTIGIVIGIVAAIVILVSQSFYYDYMASTEGGVKTEIGSEPTGEQQPDILTIGKDAVTTVVQFTITQVLQFIADLQLANSDEVQIEFDQKVELNTFFKTLFRLIISPNAP